MQELEKTPLSQESQKNKGGKRGRSRQKLGRNVDHAGCRRGKKPTKGS